MILCMTRLFWDVSLCYNITNYSEGRSPPKRIQKELVCFQGACAVEKGVHQVNSSHRTWHCYYR